MATNNSPASSTDGTSESDDASAGVDTENTDPSDHSGVHERFSAVVARLADSPNDAGGYPVRGVALGEGDITLGLSEKRTYWPAEVMQAADGNGKLGTAKLLKGSGGKGHKPIEALADPDNIIGSVELSYQPGVGIVYEGSVIDERMARLIDHGLVEVSPDMFRELGEFNSEREAHEAAEILGVPYLTVVDRGAVPSNSIEPSADEAEVEALSYADLGQLFTPDSDSDTERTEQLAASVDDAVRWQSDAGGDTEPDTARYGVVVDGLEDDDADENRVLVAVYEPSADGEGWENRGEQEPIKVANLEVIGSDGVDSLPPVSSVTGDDVDIEVEPDGDGGSEQGAEADAEDADADAPPAEQLAEVSVHEPTYSSTSEGSASFADGEWGRPSMDDFETDDLGEIADHFIASSTGFPPESYGDLMFPVVAPDGTLYLPALRAASQRLPQSDGLGDAESRIRSIIQDLADTAFDAEFGEDAESGDDSEQGADADSTTEHEHETNTDTDMSTTENTPADENSNGADADFEALKEQLSEVKSERDDLAEKVDELESKNEQLAETNEQLEADTEPVREILAERLADGSMLNAGTVADRYELGEMYDMLADASEPEPEPEPDADERLSDRKTVLSEQLAAPRGQHEPQSDPGEGSAEETDAEHDSLAHSALGVSHILEAEQLGMAPAEYTKEQLGVDPSEHSDEYELRSAINAATGGEN